MSTTQQKIDEAQIDEAFMSDDQRAEFRSLIDSGIAAWDAYDFAIQTR